MLELLLIITRIALEWQSIALIVKALLIYYATPLTIESVSQRTYDLILVLTEIVPSTPGAVWRLLVSQMVGLVLTVVLEWLWSRKSE